ncbi:hypothetical protein C7441_10543 [Pseudaminobacter salicylatoxidans]|uniref:Uncharacterized protein n=1 Tax=Pseudaminobacter salicylatoxidans TaxID=93369 RepID=A0A316C8T1_PSESE|nr:hypothetical protein C7441_10543 [Pseudaminobacter salicylatoxidans]
MAAARLLQRNLVVCKTMQKDHIFAGEAMIDMTSSEILIAGSHFLTLRID